MDYKSVYTPEPHFLPGYTGHCAHYRFRIGETYGNATHRALMEPVACKYTGRLVISDVHQTVKSGTHFRHPLMEVKPEFRNLRRSTSCNGGTCPEEIIACRQTNSENKRPCAPRPGYQCTVNLPPISEGEMVSQPRDEWFGSHDGMNCLDRPKRMGRPGFHYSPHMGRASFDDGQHMEGHHISTCSHYPPCPPSCQQYPGGRVPPKLPPCQPLHPRPPTKNVCAGGRFVLGDIRPDVAADFLEDVPCPEPSFLPPDYSTSPYFMEVGHPEKTFKHGYAGHVPFSHGAYGKSHDDQVRSQLAEFTSNYRRRQSQEWAPAEIGGINAFPRISAGPIIYPTHIGLLPKYGGHVPGDVYRYGKTYGNATRDAKRWLRGDFS